ncbi:hypothetical protein THRCLA_10131 [Thraustotheca clavata]|uniref:Protein kinase domain-containing protein n=1 Tax=Thraustotheca clavata TaxID=74557 RepID=A0A1V9YSZ0_9STRA|nr:hypothetical protein THRCLA_10131 [Thraustotheca clavata]
MDNGVFSTSLKAFQRRSDRGSALITQTPWILFLQPQCCFKTNVKFKPFKLMSFEEMYEMGELLCTGGVASVFAAARIGTNERVAIKKIVADPNHTNASMNLMDVRREIAALKALRGHPNICQLLDYHEENDILFFGV